jgi:hypothetical protein
MASGLFDSCAFKKSAAWMTGLAKMVLRIKKIAAYFSAAKYLKFLGGVFFFLFLSSLLDSKSTGLRVIFCC